MENATEFLNKMRERQFRMLALQKLTKELNDENNNKIKELNSFVEQRKLNSSILSDKKKVNAEFQFEKDMLEIELTALESILENKNKCLKSKINESETEQRTSIETRINYCDSVYNFLNKINKLDSCDPDTSSESQELRELKKQIDDLKNESEQLDRDILEKNVSLQEIQSTQTVLREKEMRYAKLLEEKKEILKNLVYKVKVLNSNKNKVESENILQELYTRNKFKYRSVELATADNVTSEDKSLENTLDFEDRKRIIHFNDLSPEFKDIKPKIADTISDNIGFNNIPEELHNRNKSVYESIELCVVDNVDFTDFRFQTHTQNFKDKKINLYLNSSSTKLEEITAMVAENHTTLDNSPFKFLSQTRPDDLPTLMNSTVTDFGKRKTNNSFNAKDFPFGKKKFIPKEPVFFKK